MMVIVIIQTNINEINAFGQKNIIINEIFDKILFDKKRYFKIFG